MEGEMRPPTKQQDPIEAPLNAILGTTGNVRVLRVLTGTGSAIGRSEVARKAALYPTGVRIVLDRLAELGLVDVIGSGRNKAVHLRERHPLTEPLRALFDSERALYNRIIRAARNAVAHGMASAKAIWVENPSSRSPGTIDIGVLGPPDEIDALIQMLEKNLREIEHDVALHFIVHGYTDADLHAASPEQGRRLEEVTLLYGWIPFRWKMNGGGPVRSHQDLDERARHIATRIAGLLTTDPSLIERALEWLDDRHRRAGTHEQHALKEWKSMLSQLSVPQIQSFLTEKSERANRLRQSLPFVDTLSETERSFVMDVSEDDQG